jgi:glycosyltransferase involved in cell wall biosynthesis
MPEVSVLLPVHGEAPYLIEAIESVKSQDYCDFELLLICDRTGDETMVAVRAAAEADSRIRIIHSEKPGLPSALNVGIREASSPLVARIDSDDLMVSDRLSIQVDEMNRDENLVCLGSQVSYLGEHSRRSSALPMWNWQIRIQAKASNPIAHPSLIMRIDALKIIGGYNEDFLLAQDYELLSRLSKIGKVRNLPSELTCYRVHKGQISMARATERLPYEVAALFANNPRGGLTPEGNLDLGLIRRLGWKSQEDVLEFTSQIKYPSSLLLFNAAKEKKAKKRLALVLRASIKDPVLVFSIIASSLLTRLILALRDVRG